MAQIDPERQREHEALGHALSAVVDFYNLACREKDAEIAALNKELERVVGLLKDARRGGGRS